MPNAQRNGKTVWHRGRFSGAISKRTSGGSRRPNTKYRKKPYNARLSDKKVNTLVEVRMQEIAKKEVENSLKVLTSRKYLFTRYSPISNEFTALSPPSDLIDWTGHVVEISNIHKTDIETRANVPQDDDPLTMGDEQKLDNDGTNQLMIGDAINGYRWSDIIYIKSVSAQLRLRSFVLDENQQLDMFQTVKVKYAFVLWIDDQTEVFDPNVKPDADQLLRMDPWGYKSSLDTVLAMRFNSLKSRILCQGETILNMNDNQTSEKYTVIYKKFNKPIQLVYDSQSQNGQKCNKKIYFVARSTVPANAAYNDVKPSLYVCTKINYYEA